MHHASKVEKTCRALPAQFLDCFENSCMHEASLECFGERALLQSGLPLGNGLCW